MALLRPEEQEFIANYGTEEAKEAARLQLQLVDALKKLDKNKDFKLLMKYVLDDMAIANYDQLAFQVENRGKIFEELVWRSAFKKELQMIRDTDVVRVEEILNS